MLHICEIFNLFKMKFYDLCVYNIVERMIY